jgi:hypothetical protein
VGGPDPEEIDKFELGPPPQLVYLRVTQSYSGTTPVSVDLTTDGPSGSVMATTKFELKFDRFMLPSSASRQAVCLHSGEAVKRDLDCTDKIGLSVRYDPVSRIATYFLGEALVDGTTYSLSIFPNTGATGFASFDGVPLNAIRSFTFTAAAPPAGQTLEAPPPVGEGYCEATKFLFGTCDSCHAINRNGMTGEITREPVMGLNLTTPEGLAQTAIGKVAHGAQKGGHASEVLANSTHFGRGLAIIDPTSAGSSYLLYKVLANPRPIKIYGDAASMEPTGELVIALDPNDPNDRIAEGEVDRLRRSVITGLPMPPTSTYTFEPEPGTKPSDSGHARLEAISNWIANGAQIDTAPCPP